MLPIAIFPIAAILSGLGYAIDASNIKSLYFIAVMFMQLGNVIIEQMPMIFAIGIAYELSEEKSGVTAFNGFLSFIIITNLLSVSNVSFLENTVSFDVDIAFNNIDNQFIGILSGLIATFSFNCLYKRKYRIPTPIFIFAICSLISVILSIVLYFVWPFIFEVLISFGFFISKLGPVGAGIYAFFNRLLIPIGMHHMLNSIFWFDVIGMNDIGNFWSSQGTLGVTGIYQAGFFPIMMFGIPAMALAMLKTSYKKNRKKIKPFLLSSAFASFFTGVTESLEFSFMFLAPWLYFLHAIITGIVVFIVAQFQWIAGFSFSAGFIDYSLSYQMPLANKPWMLIVVGIVVFFIYYILFVILIKKFNLHTPGREEDGYDSLIATKLSTKEINQMIKAIMDSCGGKDNITHIDCCLTRLRIRLKDTSKFKFRKIKHSGAIAYSKVGDEVQIVYGTQVDYIMDLLQDYQL